MQVETHTCMQQDLRDLEFDPRQPLTQKQLFILINGSGSELLMVALERVRPSTQIIKQVKIQKILGQWQMTEDFPSMSPE